MASSLVYERLLEQVDDEFCKNTMQAMLDLGALGSENRIARRALVEKVCGYNRGAGASSDRKVRLAIARLRERGVPILSDSGDGGYWLASNPDEIDGLVMELQSRVGALQATILALKTGGAYTASREIGQMQLWT